MSDLLINRRLVLKDWSGRFPFLVKLNSNSLYLVAGIVIIGLEFPSFHKEWYRPTLVVRGLWTSDNGLLLPILSVELESRGVQFDIKYRQHDYYFELAVKEVEKQFNGILQQEIQLSRIIEFVLSQFKRRPIHITPWNMYNIFNMICGFSEYFNDYSIFDRFYTIVDPPQKKWNLYKTQIPYSSPECWKQLWLDKYPIKTDLVSDVNNNINLSNKLSHLNKSLIIYNKSEVDKYLNINIVDRLLKIFSKRKL